MKFILVAIVATVLAVVFAVHSTQDAFSKDDPPIRVVPGRAPVIADLPSRYPVSPAASVNAAGTLFSNDITGGTSDEPPPPLNTEQTDEPFLSQARDPQWADHVEAFVANLLPDKGSVRCAEFICKVSVPSAGDADAAGGGEQNDDDIPDQIAATVTRNWPAEIAYNQQTARMTEGPQGRSLTFFITRNQWSELQ